MKIKYIFLLLLLFSIACKSNSESAQMNKSAYVIVRFDGIEVPDSLSLYFLKNTVNDVETHNYLPAKIITDYGNNVGQFIFKIADIDRIGYFSLNKGDFVPSNGIPIFFIDKFLIAPNDSITIDISKASDSSRFDKGLSLRRYLRRYKNMSISFAGRGAAKNRCRYKCDSMMMSHQGNLSVNHISEDTSNYFNLVFHKGLQIIDKYKDSINKLPYEILKADLVGLLNSTRYRFIYSSLMNFPQDNKIAVDKKIQFLKKDMAITTTSLNSERAKAISYYYPISILYFTSDLLATQGYKTFNIHGKKAFSLLRNNYKEELRDKLLTYFIINYYLRIQEQQSLLTKALNIVSTPYCKKLLVDFRDSHSSESLITNIPLKDKNGNSVKLTKFIGKVVFLDFWFTGCAFCKRYYQNSVSKVEEIFVDNPNVIFVSVSIDKQKKMWLNSIQNDLYSTDALPNVVNLYTGGKGGNHPIVDFYKISGYPMPIVFSKDGKLFNISDKDLRNVNGLTKQIKLALKKGN